MKEKNERIDELTANPFRHAKQSDREAYDAAQGKRTRALFQRSGDIAGPRPPEPQRTETPGIIGQAAEARIGAAEQAIGMLKTIIEHQNQRIELIEAELKLLHERAAAHVSPDVGSEPEPSGQGKTPKRIRRRKSVRLLLHRGRPRDIHNSCVQPGRGHIGEHDER